MWKIDTKIWKLILNISIIQKQAYVQHIYGQKMLGIQKIWSQSQPVILKVTNCGLNKGGSQLELMVKLQLFAR